jgi:DNA-binding MarR family transcriptional regulator
MIYVRIQKMNSQSLIKIKQQEYQLLNEIAQDSLVTQGTLSNRLGIAVGSVNWYIKRLISRGWVKVSHLDRTRLKYDVTPAGMKVFTQRAMLYARDSLKIYGEYRSKAKKLVEELKLQGVKSVYIDGDDETTDILRLTCIEAGIMITMENGGLICQTHGREYQLVRNSK